MSNERLEEIRLSRLKKRESLLKAGMPPYPAEARRTHTLEQVNQLFEQLLAASTPIVLIGRVMGIRRHGGVVFLDIRDQAAVFQLQLNRNEVPADVFDRLASVDHGDWIQASGALIRTQRGVKTLQVQAWHVLSKSIRPLPDSWFGLKDHETRFRQREVDLWLNEEVRTVFLERSRIVTWLRQYLDQQGFLEVETPILQPLPGGAAARPFTTHHTALDMDLYLRIAPELYLKRLITSGFEKVYELARNFRNEGIDREHNPEFTMLELYWAFADYEDLMELSETMLEQVVRALAAAPEVEWHGQTLSFARPFKRMRFVDLVSEHLGVDILATKDPAVYQAIVKKHELEEPAVLTYPKLIDELYKELIRPTLIQPVILYDYPIELQPLAKRNLTDPRIAEQFQLLAGGMEIIKAYTEQNDPVEQRERFIEQQQAREAGDQEMPPIDESFLRALEYGMPPTAGLGLGIDRLTAVLTNSPSVRDTILFPLLRPEQ
jgi:lysyl-tRNA synthetase class 2